MHSPRSDHWDAALLLFVISRGLLAKVFSSALSVIFLSQPSAIQIGPVVRYHDVLSLVGLYFLVLLLSL